MDLLMLWHCKPNSLNSGSLFGISIHSMPNLCEMCGKKNLNRKYLSNFIVIRVFTSQALQSFCFHRCSLNQRKVAANSIVTTNYELWACLFYFIFFRETQSEQKRWTIKSHYSRTARFHMCHELREFFFFHTFCAKSENQLNAIEKIKCVKYSLERKKKCLKPFFCVSIHEIDQSIGSRSETGAA